MKEDPRKPAPKKTVKKKKKVVYAKPWLKDAYPRDMDDGGSTVSTTTPAPTTTTTKRPLTPIERYDNTLVTTLSNIM